jgi:hypothetical protein
VKNPQTATFLQSHPGMPASQTVVHMRAGFFKQSGHRFSVLGVLPAAECCSDGRLPWALAGAGLGLAGFGLLGFGLLGDWGLRPGDCGKDARRLGLLGVPGDCSFGLPGDPSLNE